MKIRKKDTVQVISGKHKGKKGVVLKVFPEKGRVLVEGINLVKKHVKPGAVSKEGGIITKELPINVSNVMYFDSKSNKPVKLGSKIIDGKKYRVNKKSGEVLKND
ncbi:50S ribosomal protein L24 [Patescibacteria group bacterium]